MIEKITRSEQREGGELIMLLRCISKDFSKNVLKRLLFAIFVMLIFGIILIPKTLFGILDISHQSGFYNEAIQVTISSTTCGEIYYTLDGSLPKPGSFNTFFYT